MAWAPGSNGSPQVGSVVMVYNVTCRAAACNHQTLKLCNSVQFLEVRGELEGRPKRNNPVGCGALRHRTANNAGRIYFRILGAGHLSLILKILPDWKDLDAKMREKTALTKQVADLKRSKLQYETKLQKKKKDDDSAVVQTIDLEKKLQTINNSNRVATAELSGLGSENERLRQDIDALRSHLQEATTAYERECEALEGLKQALQATRKELAAETKQRDIVQQDLRASRTAQNLMINRLDDIERRNKALKNCVANALHR
ncbi:PBC1 [Symbiodinium natans]|uniref:PBC1 protein n=1 Tax=Symbiodinium natans TaxID=878477 RepID=A0A812J8Z5_9DINO|nr:PBC1 [Symbiodinium natans]